MFSGGGAELTRERDGGRKKEPQRALLQQERYIKGGLMVILGLQKQRIGSIQQCYSQGPHPLRRNSDKDDMTPPESSEVPAQKLRLTQISGT